MEWDWNSRNAFHHVWPSRMNGERKIRIFDLIGALLFIIYGVTIRSFSTILLNVVLVVVQAYKLLRRRSE